MERFLQYTFDGLSYGAIYALLALGLVIVFRGTGHLNFAQGEMGLFCAYITWQLSDWGLPLIVSALLAMVVGFALGAATERFLVAPVQKKSPFAVFVVSIGLFLGLNSLCQAIWGVEGLVFGNFFPNDPSDFVKIGGATVRYDRIGVLFVVAVLTGVFFLLFKKTKLGLAMRAVASNPDSSRLVGIRTSVVLMASWGIAAAVGSIGGSLIASINGNVNPAMMASVFVYGAAAATLGGLDSPGGAVIAGLGIGLVENYAAGYQPEWIGQELKLGVALVIIFVVLLVKPSGMFGSAKVERV
jgi:branched-chain amino acid transport system permease protein